MHKYTAFATALVVTLSLAGCSTAGPGSDPTTQYDVTATNGTISEVSYSTVDGSDPEHPDSESWTKKVGGYGISTVTATPAGSATLRCTITHLETGEIVADQTGAPGKPVECEAYLPQN